MRTVNAYAATSPTEPLSPATIETVSADRLNDAYERVLASDVRYRFVIDNSTLA